MVDESRRSFSLRDVYEAGAEFTEVSRDRAQRFVDHLVSEGKVTQTQASDAVADVVEWSRTRAGRFRDAVRDELEDALKTLRVPTREDFADLERRVEEIARAVRERVAGGIEADVASTEAAADLRAITEPEPQPVAAAPKSKTKAKAKANGGESVKERAAKAKAKKAAAKKAAAKKTEKLPKDAKSAKPASAPKVTKKSPKKAG